MKSATLLTSSMIVLGLLTGCGRIESSHVVTGRPSAATSGDVMIVMQGREAEGEFDEIAVIQAKGLGTKAKMPVVLDQLKVEARALGANGIINVRIDQGHSSVSASGVGVRFRQGVPSP